MKCSKRDDETRAAVAGNLSFFLPATPGRPLSPAGLHYNALYERLLGKFSPPLPRGSNPSTFQDLFLYSIRLWTNHDLTLDKIIGSLHPYVCVTD